MILLNKNNISQVLGSIDNILLDCDGVIWAGAGSGKILNSANKAINKLKDLGKKIFLVTNSSVRTHESFMEKCISFDINIEKESAICAPYIMAQYLKNIEFNKKIYIIGTQGFADELKLWGFECVGPSPEVIEYKDIYEAVVNKQFELDPDVGAVAVGFDGDLNYAKLVKANCYLSDPKCLLLANNIDVKYPIINTNYNLPAGGVMVRAVEAASGRKAIVVGKPSTLMFDVLRSKYGLDPERTLMIGDTLYTDIAFGNRCKMQTLLVLTGVSSLEDVQNLSANEENKAENSDLIPQFYLPSLGDIIELLE